MIAGTVNDSFEPIVDIGLIRNGDITIVPAVVDTGFSGDLCVSIRHIDAMDLEFSYVDRYELADGTIIAKDVFSGHAEFDGQRRDVDVILTDSPDTLIGGSMLQAHVLNVDYPGGTVRIEGRLAES